MSQADSATARLVLDRWGAEIRPVAARHGLDWWLVAAVVCQESAGNPFAWRPEVEFLSHYGPKILEELQGMSDPERRRYLRWWKIDPMLFASSFGLCQVLLIVSLERGMALPFPTMLCEPGINFEAGCRQLRFCFDRVKAKASTTPIRDALLRWNGGGNAAYPDEVTAWQNALMATANMGSA